METKNIEMIDNTKTLANLILEEKNLVESEDEKETQSRLTCKFYPVRKVISHSITNEGTWEFELQFNDGNIVTVSDDDCRCEELIQEYLSGLNINTTYCLCRVSSKRQSGPTHVSLDAQASQLKKTALQMCKKNRIKVLRLSASAYKGIPPLLLELGQLCRKGDIIMTYRVDRLSRNIIKYLDFLEELDTKGIKMFAQDENLWYNEHKLYFIQYILDAQKEASMISKRIKMTNQYRKDRGDEALGSVPYGHRLKHIKNKDGKTVKIIKELVPEEQALIHKIKYGEEEASILASQFNRQNLLKRGKRWTTAMVLYIRRKY